MIRYYGKYRDKYGGIFGKTKICQDVNFYGCGEVRSIEWKDVKNGEVIVQLKYLCEDPTGWYRDPIILTGIEKEKKESIKDKLLGKKTPPKLDFGVGDMIMFLGFHRVYNGTYAHKKGIKEKCPYFVNKIILINDIKVLSVPEAIEKVDKIFDNDEFEKIYIEQQEKKQPN